MPRKPRKPTKQSLLWINKDVTSSQLTRSQEKDASIILSHVQRRRRDTEENKAEGLPLWTRFTTCWPAVPEAASTQLPSIYPSDNSSDPFYATVLGGDTRHHVILDYFSSLTIKVVFLTEAFAPFSTIPQRSSMRHDRIIAARLQRCVEDEMLMYATLTYDSTLRGWMSGQTEDDRPPEYYLAKSLRLIRYRLQQQEDLQDKWLLHSVYSLAVSDFWNNSAIMWSLQAGRKARLMKSEDETLQASRTHLKALSYLVDLQGGWHMVDPYILESTILADKYIALKEMTAPLLSPQSFDPGPMAQERQRALGIRVGGPSGLGVKLLQLAIGEELQCIVRDVVDYTQVAHRAWKCANISPEDESWLFLRLQSFTHRLLCMGVRVGLQRCVQVTLFLVLLNATQYRGACVAAQIQLPRLRAAIEARLWKIESKDDLQLWCLCTGAMTEGHPDTEWFVGMLNALPHLPMGPALPESLRGFLFLED